MSTDKRRDQEMVWRVIQSELALSNKWAKVRCDTCELPNGTVIPDYFYWEGGDFVQIFAVTPSNEVVLTRQYKHGVKEIVTELPAGLIDRSETPLLAAKRELTEESGYTAPIWVNLGVLNVSSAKATTRAHVFLAKDASQTFEQQLDANEEIEVILVNSEQLHALIATREIKDSSSLATTLLASYALGWP